MTDEKEEEKVGSMEASVSTPTPKDVEIYGTLSSLRSNNGLASFGSTSFLTGDEALYSSLSSILPIIPRSIGCLKWDHLLAFMPWPAPSPANPVTPGALTPSFGFKKLRKSESCSRANGSAVSVTKDDSGVGDARYRRFFSRSSLDRSVITRAPRRRCDRRLWRTNKVQDMPIAMEESNGVEKSPDDELCVECIEQDAGAAVCMACVSKPRVDPLWPSPEAEEDLRDVEITSSSTLPRSDSFATNSTEPCGSQRGCSKSYSDSDERTKGDAKPECGPRTFFCKAGVATRLCCSKVISGICDAACQVCWAGSYWCRRGIMCRRRTDKTEILTEELLDVDRRLEILQRVCQVSFKRVKECLVGVGAGVDDASREKRLKKLPTHQMALAVYNQSESVDEGEPLAKVLRNYGRISQDMSAEYLDHEVEVEKIFLAPLSKLLDNDFPALAKQKSKLQKLALDLDGARSRYSHAVKSQAEPTKIDALREEVEDYQAKVDTCRDILAGDMYQMLARQSEVAQLFIQMAREQKKYHESSWRLLNELLPDLESNIKENPSQRVWKTPLEEHLRVTNREIALPLEFCVRALLKYGTKEEGLFRIAGSNSKVRRLKLSLDASAADIPDVNDPHVVASALKSYLRDLPEPLMTYGLYKEWLKVAEIRDGQEKVDMVKQLVDKLPESHRANLRYLMKFLARLCQSQDVNKMSSQNVAIVMAPNLMWSPTDVGTNLSMNMNDNGLVCSVIDSMLTYCEEIFPGDENFKRSALPDSEETSESEDQGHQTTSGAGHRRHASNDGVVEDPRASDVSQTSSANHSPTLVPNSPRQGPKRKNRAAPVPPRPQKPPPPKPAVSPPSVPSGTAATVLVAASVSAQQNLTAGVGSSAHGAMPSPRVEPKNQQQQLQQRSPPLKEENIDDADVVVIHSKGEQDVPDAAKGKRDEIGFEAFLPGRPSGTTTTFITGDQEDLSPPGHGNNVSGQKPPLAARPKPELPERTVSVLSSAGPPRPDSAGEGEKIPIGFNVGLADQSQQVTSSGEAKPVPAERKHVRQGSGSDLPMLRPKPIVPGRPSVLKRNSMLEKGSRTVPPARMVTSCGAVADDAAETSPSPPPALPLKQRNAVYIKAETPLHSVEVESPTAPPDGLSSTAEGESPSVKQKPPRPAPPSSHVVTRESSLLSPATTPTDPTGDDHHAPVKPRANSDAHDTKM